MRDAPRRRILVVTPRDPYPTFGGDRLRIHRLARELAKHHDLTLLTLCRSEKEKHAPPADDGVFKEVHRVVLPTWKSWLNTLRALPTSEPLQIAYYRCKPFMEAAQALAASHHAVVAHLVRTADCVRDAQAVRVLEMTDAISMNMERVVRQKCDYFDLRPLLYRVEARRLAAHERRIAKDFDLVSLCSPVDRDFLFGRPLVEDDNSIVIPNGSDIPEYVPLPQPARAESEIAFVGNLNSLQNFDAAWFFARHVLPLVRERIPQAVLRIIGPIGRMGHRRLSSLPGVRIEGIVPRMDVALSTARVGVCPVRMCAGIQNKVLDYFANRLAVVSSSEGAEGIAARHDEHLLLANSVDEWAANVIRLIKDVPLSQRLADAGWSLVREQHRWEKCAQPLLRQLQTLFAQRYSDSATPNGLASAA